jgi:hypothetical protein
MGCFHYSGRCFFFCFSGAVWEKREKERTHFAITFIISARAPLLILIVCVACVQTKRGKREINQRGADKTVLTPAMKKVLSDGIARSFGSHC